MSLLAVALNIRNTNQMFEFNLFNFSFLLEKDINGEVTCELDLTSLFSLDRSVANDNNDCERHVVELRFDYVSKHKSERKYAMEDVESCDVRLQNLYES